MTAHTAPVPAGGLATGTRAKPAWTRLAATGLFLIALAPAVLLASAIVAGLDVGEDAGFFLTLIVVPAVTGGLVLRFGTWAKVLGAVVSVLAVGAMFWMAFGLAFPTSFADFTAGVALPVGVLTGLGGSIAALLARRRGHIAEGLDGAERWGVMVVTGLVAAAALVSLPLDLFTGGAVVASADAATATMRDFAFAEETYTIAAGRDSEVVVHNSDPFVHDFAVPALGIDPVTVGPGSEALVEITGAEAGTYTIYCTLHSDTSAADGGEDGMAATLVVE